MRRATAVLVGGMLLVLCACSSEVIPTANGSPSAQATARPTSVAGLGPSSSSVPASGLGDPPGTASSPTPSLDPRFPTAVLGLPVHSVSDAIALRDAGMLDGRAIAIAGWWSEPAVQAQCPAFQVNEPLLNAECNLGSGSLMARPEVLATVRRDESGHITEVTDAAPHGPYLGPLAYGNGPDPWLGDPSAGRLSPAPAVMVAHPGDPAMWGCTEESREACRGTFVIDRMAWGSGVELPAPEVTKPPAFAVDPTTAATAAAKALPPGSDVISLAATDVGWMDGRLSPLPGSQWVVRAMTGDVDGAGAREIDQVVIDGSSGEVLDVRPLATPPGEEPGTVFVDVTSARFTPPKLRERWGFQLVSESGDVNRPTVNGWEISGRVAPSGPYKLQAGWFEPRAHGQTSFKEGCSIPIWLAPGQIDWFHLELHADRSCSLEGELSPL